MAAETQSRSRLRVMYAAEGIRQGHNNQGTVVGLQSLPMSYLHLAGWLTPLQVVDDYLESVKKYPNPHAPNLTRFGG